MSRLWTLDDHQPASPASDPPHGSGMASAGRVLDAERARLARSWQPPVPAPPVIRKPQFMLGGRLAVVREPRFMLAASSPATPPRSLRSASRAGVAPTTGRRAESGGQGRLFFLKPPDRERADSRRGH